MTLPLTCLISILPALVAPAPAGDAASVLEAARAKARAVAEARTAHVQAGKNSRDFRADCSQELADFEARLAGEQRPEVRHALLVGRFFLMVLARETPSAAFLSQVRKEVPATSPAWGLNPAMLAARAEEEPQVWGAYAAEARAKNPDPELRRILTFEYFWERLDAKDEAAWKPAYEVLQKEFADSRQGKLAREILEGELKTGIGRPAPAFSVKALGDPGTTYTLESFKGRYLLLDFWATWCGPCRAEMPSMHAAWAKFKGRSFDLLSLSFDRRIEHIAPFRAQPATPMPWKHAFIEGGFQNPLSEAYGVKGIPKPLLIGPDGKIVASGADLRGENLAKTLAKFLGN